MVDKTYCMSSYLVFRYIERDGMEFAEGLHYENFVLMPKEARIPVRTHEDMDASMRDVFDGLSGKRLSIMLSGGMDSASLAAYMPGADAHTFRFLSDDFGSAPTNGKRMCTNSQKRVSALCISHIRRICSAKTNDALVELRREEDETKE